MTVDPPPPAGRPPPPDPAPPAPPPNPSPAAAPAAEATAAAPPALVDALLDELRRRTEGLLLPSEGDAPITVALLEQAPSPEALRVASGAAGDASVEELPLAALFSDLERTHPSQDEQEAAEARRFQELHTLLRERLQEARVYRVGAVEITVWVVGRDEQGRWVGLRSQVTET
jgi:hypothetical protein